MEPRGGCASRCQRAALVVVITLASTLVFAAAQDSSASSPAASPGQKKFSGLNVTTGYVLDTTQTFTTTMTLTSTATGVLGDSILPSVPVDGVIVGENLTAQGVPDSIRMVGCLLVCPALHASFSQLAGLSTCMSVCRTCPVCIVELESHPYPA
jgi:hypothetical protein